MRLPTPTAPSHPTALHDPQAVPPAGEVLLRAEGLRVVLGKRPVLDNVSLHLEAGRILTVIGPNGAGKTTLLRVLMGIRAADTGTVWRKPGLRLGYLPQRLHVDPILPLTAGRFLRMGPKVSKARITEVLGEVGASALADQMLHDLSGGELQRVLLARALLRNPQLLILDEPVQGVDVTGQLELYRLIGRIRTEHQCAVLMVSHDLHLVMAATDSVLCLNHHVCCQGRPEAVVNDPGYLDLFGVRAGANLALYTHQHDHVHPEPHLAPQPPQADGAEDHANDHAADSAGDRGGAG